LLEAKDKVTIVLPVLNEEEAIGKVIEELRVEGYSNILVVDGYSKDRTVEVAKENGVQLLFQHGSGKTGAVKTALEYVKTPFLLVMDGDWTYCAKDIERLLNHCERHAHVIGVRDREKMGSVHRFGNWVITRTFDLLFGTAFSDVCSGMYLLKTDVARELELRSGGFRTEVEILAQTIPECDVTEVPISYRRRIGKPRLSTWRHGFEILHCVIGLARRHNPVFLFSSLAAATMIPATLVIAWTLYLNFFVGRWEFNWLLFGSILFLFGGLGMAVATIALLLKRVERRILQRIEKENE